MRLSCLRRVLVRLIYAALILLAAGMVGGGAMLVLLIVVDAFVAVGAAFNADFGTFGAGLLVGVVAFPFWLIGAFVVGPPLWAALHLARLRGRRTALIAGALAGAVAVPLALWMLNGCGAPLLSPESFAGVAMLSAIAGISGAGAGEAIRRMAYRSGEAGDAR